ncbi:MAG: ABC transporter permease [Thaumarchaeota archaeon]|nr:ABC transporter permease [Nitrososphaerota archaeon]
MSEPSNIIYWSLGSMLRTTMPILIGMAVLGVVSGTILQSFEKQLLIYPSILFLIPALIGIGGNLGTIFGSRFATCIHLGILEFKFSNPIFRNNIIAILIVNIIIFLILGFMSYFIINLIGIGVLSLTNVVLLSFFAGLILTSALIPTAIFVAYISYRKGLDPDDTIIPTVTPTGDIIGILALLAVIVLLL